MTVTILWIHEKEMRKKSTIVAHFLISDTRVTLVFQSSVLSCIVWETN